MTPVTGLATPEIQSRVASGQVQHVFTVGALNELRTDGVKTRRDFADEVYLAVTLSDTVDVLKVLKKNSRG